MFPSIKLLSVLAVACSVTSALPLDARASGTGITLVNKSGKTQLYSFFDNLWNGVGTAGANFDHPMANPPTLKAGESRFIPLPSSFKGRVQRGNSGLIPATWVEFQLNDGTGKAWGDVSVQQGNDGAATLKGNVVVGFTQDLIKDAPAGAFAKDAAGAAFKRPDGTVAHVLGSTVGNWIPKNVEALNWYKKRITDGKTYFMDGAAGASGTTVANSNGQFTVDFY
ncbi:hypothetical protein HYFRA_00013196 [Hymenoscyphus fraxineus]|uniref:Uncharacterized protein n=1 Tax=Hymenoscyphus fraxineus TaxID=746836 RepID=A0A9N9PYI2_9HELO|nr:hypothetical protein HYFRA_00013196 [Hymenoscyphus fraxineus]